MEDSPEEFTEDDEMKRKELLSEGFTKWTKKDFCKFIKACELYGLQNFESISKMMKSKTPDEVKTYCEIFVDRYEEVPGGKRIWSRINKYENEKLKIIEFQEIIDNKFLEIANQHNDIYKNLKIPYKVMKGKRNMDLFNEEEDRYLMCLLFKYGFGNWNLVKNHILSDPTVKFNFNLKVK